MNICGIVCEYNPFHNGHEYHIKKTKELGFDGVICVMSGNFVQRGEPALLQKAKRAKAAVLSGADLVLELPLPWAVSSAEHFARGAVSLINALGVAASVSFGAESEIEPLCDVADALLSEEYESKFFAEYEKGISYAKARERALAGISPYAALLELPNNILAVEYIKAIKRLGAPLSPIAIKRTGADHDSDFCDGGFASASHIRSLFKAGEDVSAFLPEGSYGILISEDMQKHIPVFGKAFDCAVMSHLKHFSEADFANIRDVSEGLEKRLLRAVQSSSSVDEAIDKVKTKRYARSRICRIFLNAFLGIDRSLSLESVPYARVLAFNENGRKILKEAKKHSQIPIITRPSAIKFESDALQKLFALERRADDIYSLFCGSPEKQGYTLTTSPAFAKD